MTLDVHDGLLQVFDVDHGACALLTMRTPVGAKRVMVDCGHSADLGGRPWTPGAHLRRLGIGHVDLLVCTNYDEDHASGVPSLVQNGISVGCILGNPSVPPEVISHLKSGDGMGSGIRALSTAMAMRREKGLVEDVPNIPGVELTWAWNQWPYWNSENNLSLVLYMRVWQTNFLFTGDMERDGFECLLRNERFSALMPSVHVLLAPHHGRENGRCPKLFEDHRCRPQLVVVSDCAKRHQSQETVPYYAQKASGVTNVRSQAARFVMATRSDGEILFRWEGRQAFVY